MFDTLAKGGRVVYRGRTFAAVGKPVRIGAATPRQLGSVEWEAPSRSATIFVGRAKGKNPENRAGRCAAAPETASIQSIDRWFTMVRAAQVGREAVGATRLEAAGWYKGAPEQSVSYQVFPDEHETETSFKTNMQTLAEDLAEHFCQDSIIVSLKTGGEEAMGVKWDPPGLAGKKRKGGKRRRR